MGPHPRRIGAVGFRHSMRSPSRRSVASAATAKAASRNPSVAQLAGRTAMSYPARLSHGPAEPADGPRSMISSSAGRNRYFCRRSPTTQSPQIAPISNCKKTGGPPPFSCGIDYFTRGVLPAAAPAPRFFTNNHAQPATPPKSAGARQSQLRSVSHKLLLLQCSRLLSRSHGGGRVDRGLCLPSSAAGYR